MKYKAELFTGHGKPSTDKQRQQFSDDPITLKKWAEEILKEHPKGYVVISRSAWVEVTTIYPVEDNVSLIR